MNFVVDCSGSYQGARLSYITYNIYTHGLSPLGSNQQNVAERHRHVVYNVIATEKTACPIPAIRVPKSQRTTAEVASRHIWGTPWDPWDGVGTLSSPHTCEPHDMHGLSQAVQPGCSQAQRCPARQASMGCPQQGKHQTHPGSRGTHSTIVCIDSLHVSRSGGPELLVVIKVGPVGVRSRRGRALDFSCLGAAVTVQTWGWARRRRHGFMHAVSI